MKKTIQVDMFEVQLGAAMLMQFRLSTDQVVSVLADAGVDKASGYAIDHVYGKLIDHAGNPTEVWDAFIKAGDTPRLNLIIGTHYDADHLRGLVPIIESPHLVIDEIWLPPVQDDQADVSENSVSGGGAHLALKLLADDSGSQVIAGYLERKARSIGQIDAVYQDLARREIDLATFGIEGVERGMDVPQFDSDSLERHGFERVTAYFEAQIQLANGQLHISPEADHHAHDHDEPEATDRLHQAIDDSRSRMGYQLSHWDQQLRIWDSLQDELGRNRYIPAFMDDVRPREFLALENIRKSHAKDAITAIFLNDVVQAIKARAVAGISPPIRVRCETISEGIPKYFGWKKNRFVQSNADYKAELGFHLLGPSKQLVAKLQEKIPVGTMMLAYRVSGLNSGSVTPSNRLSYVLRFHLNDEAILVSGDAGFSDFAPARTTHFFAGLLEQLKSLHVVQVAHHGGINHRFYQALDAADLPKQAHWCYLLLSHAANDATRPRAEFANFVALFRQGQKEDVSVLFTSQPLATNVGAFSDLVHPPVLPAGKAPSAQADVRLGYHADPDASNSNTGWQVEAHGIQV